MSTELVAKGGSIVAPVLRSQRAAGRIVKPLINSSEEARNPRLQQEKANHGKHIYVYYQFQTNQVAYSLSRILDNHAVLSQLPNFGKKTVPAALRKDLWRPLATITLPHPHIGLSTYRLLREYKRMHEVAWEPVDPETGEAFETMPTKKQRQKMLLDQKANSVADLARVLFDQKVKFQAALEQNEVIEQKELEKAWKKFDKLKELAEKGKTGGIEFAEQKIQQMEGKVAATEDAKQKEQYEKGITDWEKYRNRLLHAARHIENAEQAKGFIPKLEQQLQANQDEVSEAEKALESLRKEYGLANQRLQEPPPKDKNPTTLRRQVRELHKQIQGTERRLAELHSSMIDLKARLDKVRLKNPDTSINVYPKPSQALLALKAQSGAITAAQVEIDQLEKKLKLVKAHYERLDKLLEDKEQLKPLAMKVAIREKKREAAVKYRDELVAAEKAYNENPLRVRQVPKYGRQRKFMLKGPFQEFSLEGTKIAWQDIMDAEFAEQWPEEVVHTIMGPTRNVAPHPDEEPATVGMGEAEIAAKRKITVEQYRKDLRRQERMETSRNREARRQIRSEAAEKGMTVDEYREELQKQEQEQKQIEESSSRK